MIEVAQGGHHDINIVVKDDAGAVVDITGYSITFVIAPHVDAVALITKTVGSGITVTDAAAGALTVSLSDTDTDRRGAYYYECRVIDGATNKAPLLTGGISFSPRLL